MHKSFAVLYYWAGKLGLSEPIFEEIGWNLRILTLNTHERLEKPDKFHA